MTAKEQIGGKIFEFILDMAFRDATMRSAFPNPFKNSKGKAADEEKEKFECLKSRIKNIIKEPIQEYFALLTKSADTISSEEEDPVYKCISDVVARAQSVCKEKTNAKFTFGHAQKVVNMAAKYLYIAHYADQSIRDNFKICHCPMDSIMIKGLIKEVERINEEGLKIENLKNDLAWSKIDADDYKTYKEFQDVIKELSEREGLIPLEYDYNHWAVFAEDM